MWRVFLPTHDRHINGGFAAPIFRANGICYDAACTCDNDEAGIPILTPDINYIVLGEKPILPDKPGPDEFDPVKIAEYQALLAAYEAYFRIVDDAKIMRIPVLNQERFLDLTGYYER